MPVQEHLNGRESADNTGSDSSGLGRLGNLASRVKSEEKDSAYREADRGGYGTEETGSTQEAVQVDTNPDKRKAAAQKNEKAEREKQRERKAKTEPKADNPASVVVKTPENTADKPVDDTTPKPVQPVATAGGASYETTSTKPKINIDANALADNVAAQATVQTPEQQVQQQPQQPKQQAKKVDSVQNLGIAERARKNAEAFRQQNIPEQIVEDVNEERNLPLAGRINREVDRVVHPPEPLSVEQQRTQILSDYEEARKDVMNQVFDYAHDYTMERMRNPLAENQPRTHPELFMRAHIASMELQQQETLDEYNQRVGSEGLREEGETSGIDFTDRSTEKRQKNIWQKVIDSFLVGLFPVETAHIQTNPVTGAREIRWSENIESRMKSILEYTNNFDSYRNRRNIFRSVILYAGISVDRNGKIFNENAEDFYLSEADMCRILDLMLTSCRENGTPFGIIGDGTLLHGTKMFPCGVMPKVLADFWTAPGSDLRSPDGNIMSSHDLVQVTADQWNKDTYPKIKANLVGDLKSQRIVLEDFMRGVSKIDGIDPNRFTERYGVRSEMDHCINELMNHDSEYRAMMTDVPMSNEVSEASTKKIEFYRNTVNKDRGQVKAVDTNGEIEYTNYKQVGTPEQCVRFYTKLARSSGIALNLPVIIGAFIEHGVGNFRTKMVIEGINYAFGIEYKLSPMTMEMIHSDEFVETFQCVKELYDTFGPGACRLFALTGQPYTKENISEFANTELRKAHKEGKFNEHIDNWEQRLDKLTHSLMVGDAAFKKMDAELWFNAFLTANAVMAHSRESGGTTQTPLTTQEIESAMRASDFGTFFSQAMGIDSGIEAYNMMRANNIGQMSPMSYCVNQTLHRHPNVDAFITMFVDTYPRYGINFIYMLTPFSKTLTYINQQKIRPALKPEGEYSEEYSDMYIGGNMGDFTTGLVMNLVYDAGMLFHNVLIGGMVGMVIAALGFTPPDDDDYINDVESWRIGRNFGWGKDGKGVEIKTAWWLNDITLLQLPVAYFTAAITTGQSEDQARKLMESSLGKTIDGNVLLDFVNTMRTWKDDIAEFDKMIQDPEYQGPTDRLTAYANNAFYVAVKGVCKIDPFSPVYRNWMRDSWLRGENAGEPDPWHVFNKSNEWNKKHGITNSVSYDEYVRRKLSMSNFVLAGIMDLGQAITGNRESGTGYFWWEMPEKSRLDPAQLIYYNQYQIDLDKIPDSFTCDYPENVTSEEDRKRYRQDAYIQSQTDNFLKMVDEYGIEHWQQAVNDGFCLDKDTRNYILNELKTRKSYLLADWFAKDNAGEKNEAKSAYYDYVNKLTGIKKMWLSNNDIPTYPYKYKQVISNWRVRYVDNTTGEYVSDLWGVLNPFGTTAIYEPKGDHPNSIMPITSVDFDDRGWNAETRAAWMTTEGGAQSNLDKIRNTIGNSTITMGKDKGKTLNDVLFHENNNGTYAHPDDATIGHRSYIYEKESSDLDDEFYKNLWDDSSYTASSVYGDAGKYNQSLVDAANGKTNGTSYGSGKGYTYATPYARSSYGAGTSAGSGNYNPKIYSNARQLNASKAASMYTKQPYTAQTSYLRPSFSTKGSREAYRRQDI